MLLVQFLSKKDRAIEAAILGEALARNNPKMPRASVAAALAVFAYNSALAKLKESPARTDEGEEADIRRIVELARIRGKELAQRRPDRRDPPRARLLSVESRQEFRSGLANLQPDRRRLLRGLPGPPRDGRRHVLHGPPRPEGPEIPRRACQEHHRPGAAISCDAGRTRSFARAAGQRAGEPDRVVGRRQHHAGAALLHGQRLRQSRRRRSRPSPSRSRSSRLPTTSARKVSTQRSATISVTPFAA